MFTGLRSSVHVQCDGLCICVSECAFVVCLFLFAMCDCLHMHRVDRMCNCVYICAHVVKCVSFLWLSVHASVHLCVWVCSCLCVCVGVFVLC